MPLVSRGLLPPGSQAKPACRTRPIRRTNIAVAEDRFTFEHNQTRIADEARLDGFYVIRTSVEDKALAAEWSAPIRASPASSAPFRSLKTVDLHVRPIHHWLAPLVRAHVFLCMLTCHVE